VKSSSPKRNLATRIRDPKIQTIILFLILAFYFLFKNLYFALNIGAGISPDETTWFGKCLVFSKFFFLPTDSSDSYEYGLVTHIPYLYFWLMGKVIPLNIFDVSDLIFLRCINICIGLATLWFAWKTIVMLTESNITRLLFIVMCTNTLMLTFLNSFVSYDNLVMFFAVSSLYFLFSYFENRRVSHLLLCICLVLAGCLTKLSFLPYAVLIFLAFLLKEYNRLAPLMVEFKSCFLFKSARRSALMAMFLFLLFLNIDLHGGNLINFGSLSAPAIEVVGLENAMKYRMFARGYVVRQFKENNLSLKEANQLATNTIKNRGDRASALSLLKLAAAEKDQKRKNRMDRFHYAFPWIELNMSRAFGVAGHKAMLKTGTSLVPYMFIFLLGAALMIRKFRMSDMSGNALILLLILVGYALVLMQSVNYKTYYSSGTIYLALSGRYMFPVLYAGYALLAYYLTNFKSTILNMVAAIIVAAVFIAGDFPWFLSRVTDSWYFPG
jgi:hypothetical protein